MRLDVHRCKTNFIQVYIFFFESDNTTTGYFLSLYPWAAVKCWLQVFLPDVRYTVPQKYAQLSKETLNIHAADHVMNGNCRFRMQTALWMIHRIDFSWVNHSLSGTQTRPLFARIHWVIIHFIDKQIEFLNSTSYNIYP